MVPIDPYDFDLPEDRIARYPAKERDASRLLLVSPRTGEVRDAGRFRDLARLLREGDLLVLNDARVVPARLFGRRKTGAKVEALLLGFGTGKVPALVRPLARLKENEVLDFAGTQVRFVSHGDDGIAILDFGETPAEEVAARAGEVPIPPYLKRPAEPLDAERYQTVYAERGRAVAAPTAGLHFTEELLAEVERRGVETIQITLEVGYGTFQPMRSEQTTLHKERYEISPGALRRIEEARKAHRRVVAVGTTVVRALESYAATGRREGETGLYIRPGYAFRVVDALVTNFHLPGSSLLRLVHAFAGDLVFEAYRRAIEDGYRFFSYGDAMFLSERAR